MRTACPALTRLAADQMVVSVGPYMFHKEPQRDSNRSANSRSQASPPHRILKFECPVHPASSNRRQVAGGATTLLNPLFREAGGVPRISSTQIMCGKLPPLAAAARPPPNPPNAVSVTTALARVSSRTKATRSFG